MGKKKKKKHSVLPHTQALPEKLEQVLAKIEPVTPSRPVTTNLAGNREKRLQIIRRIELSRNSRVIAYITADRRNLGAQLAEDVVPLFFEHLQRIGETERIDLFLYTRGGYTLAPNRLVHLLREHCKHLGVLIPWRAHSAGTTLALGANEIVMHRMGELGPIDPSVANEFNPVDPKDPEGKRRITISVEDVTAYLSLATERANVPAQGMETVFGALTRELHPLALGNIHRQYLLIRTMGKRLLGLHMNLVEDAKKIDEIIDILTEKLYFHAYTISRHEAKNAVGLNVSYPEKALESDLWDLYLLYKEDLGLDGGEINFETIAGTDAAREFAVDSAVIESEDLLNSFRYKGTIRKRKVGEKVEFDVQVKSGWTLTARKEEGHGGAQGSTAQSKS